MSGAPRTPSRSSPAPRKGIGAAIAKALAADGWAVAVNYRSDEAGADATVEAIEEAGGKAKAFHADVTNGDAKALLEAGRGASSAPCSRSSTTPASRATASRSSSTDDDWDTRHRHQPDRRPSG